MKLQDISAIFVNHEVELIQRGVKELAIFGSVARGDSSPHSDVDILVEFDRPIGLFEFIRLKILLEEWLGCQVDLATPDALHPAMRERILNEAIYVR